MTLQTSRGESFVLKDEASVVSGSLPYASYKLHLSFPEEEESITGEESSVDSESSISLNDDADNDDSEWYLDDLSATTHDSELPNFRTSCFAKCPGTPETAANMSSVRTFNTMLLDELQSTSHEDTIMIKNDSFCGPLIQEEELSDEQDATSHNLLYTFSKNMSFLGGLVSEAASNMVKTIVVLREEPKPRILKAVVEAKVENLGKNMAAMLGGSVNRCYRKGGTNLNWAGIGQHLQRSIEEEGGANWLSASLHGFGNRNKELGSPNLLGKSHHGFGNNRCIGRGAVNWLDTSHHGFQRQNTR